MRSRLASLAVVTISSSSEETSAVVNSHERVTWLLLSSSFCKTSVWQIYKDTISVTIIAVYDLLFAKEESCTTQLAIWQLFVSVRWPKRWEQLLTSITTFRSKLVFFVPSWSSFVVWPTDVTGFSLSNAHKPEPFQYHLIYFGSVVQKALDSPSLT